MFLAFGRTGGIACEADALHRVGLVSSYSAEPSGFTAANETREMPAGVVQEAPIPDLPALVPERGGSTPKPPVVYPREIGRP